MRKKLIIASTIALVSAIGVFVYYRYNSPQPSANNPKSFENNYVENEDQPLVNESDESTSTVENEKTILPAPTEQPASIEQPNLTRAEISGDFLRVSAIYSQASNGECVLTIKRDGYNTYVENAAIIVGPNYYTCNGFRVAKSQFAQGQWEATITHRWNDSVSTSDTRTINVQ